MKKTAKNTPSQTAKITLMQFNKLSSLSERIEKISPEIVHKLIQQSATANHTTIKPSDYTKFALVLFSELIQPTIPLLKQYNTANKAQNYIVSDKETAYVFDISPALTGEECDELERIITASSACFAELNLRFSVVNYTTLRFSILA